MKQKIMNQWRVQKAVSAIFHLFMEDNPISWKNRWLQSIWPGFDLIIFDCDSTLSTIEGIDEMARHKGKFDQVKQMTDAAMDGEVHLQTVYDRRLQLLSPTRAEIRMLEYQYRETLVPDVTEVIQALLSIKKELFIVSGGLLAAVRPFGEWLGIPRENIRAVAVNYNRLSGEWWDYQRDRWGSPPDEKYLDPDKSPLVESQGKADVIRELLAHKPGRSMLVGDGMSDIAAKPVVDIMVGFGGVVVRHGVERQADVFIRSTTLAPVLALALSSTERNTMARSKYQPVLDKGLESIETGQVIFST
jgi:phosphoserine phosphatase